MRLYVGFTVFQTIGDPADIGRIRAKFGEKVQEMQQAGKLETDGIFADNRQGFLVLNVASEDEAFMLLNEIADFCVMETHPLVSFETLGKYFRGASPELTAMKRYGSARDRWTTAAESTI